MKVTPFDATSLTVGGQRLTTAQVDQLIHDLAMARNDLAPQVPIDMRRLGGNVVQQHDPDIQVILNAERDILMGIRHRGLGWFVFTLSPGHAARLRDYLAKRTGGIPAVAVKKPQAGRAH